MRVFRRLADNDLLYDTLVILLVVVLRLCFSGVFSSCITHPAIFNVVLGSYRVQQAAVGYLMVAGLVKGLLGEVPLGPGTHIRKT